VQLGSASSNATGDDPSEATVGLKLTLSLASGLEFSQEARSLKSQAQAAKLIADFKKGEIEVHMNNELAELRFLHDQIHGAETNILRAEKYYKLTQSEYARGVKNSPDVLGSAERLFNAKLKHLEIVRDFQVAKVHILAKLGK
jgi:outer membrane protein TolC